MRIIRIMNVIRIFKMMNIQIYIFMYIRMFISMYIYIYIYTYTCV
jgi:hypothetical protein